MKNSMKFSSFPQQRDNNRNNKRKQTYHISKCYKNNVWMRWFICVLSCNHPDHKYRKVYQHWHSCRYYTKKHIQYVQHFVKFIRISYNTQSINCLYHAIFSNNNFLQQSRRIYKNILSFTKCNHHIKPTCIKKTRMKYIHKKLQNRNPS